MSRPKWDVLWSPFHSDRFITWDSDAQLNLYEIGPRDNSVRETDQTCKLASACYTKRAQKDYSKRLYT